MGAVAASMETEFVPESGHEHVRVLHVYSGNMFGGVEWFLRTLAEHGGHAPWMTSEFALCFAGKIANDLRSLGARVHMLGEARFRMPRQVDAARVALSRVLETGRYDVVVCHSAWPHAMFAPVVRTHGARLVQFMHDVPNRRGWIDHLANRTTPDLVMCNTHFMANAGPWWFHGVPRQMLRYPVPVARVPESTRATLRAALGASEDDVVILHASRMQEWKGHRVLIEALASIRANPRWICWIAGGAQRPGEMDYERDLRASVEQHGLSRRVQFLGHRDDIPAVMASSDIYCQPNIAPEPFGVSFLEALAAGLPVVTTAMGGPLEIVDDSCGMLVPRDARDVSAALTLLVDDDERRATLSRAAPVRARELCDVPTRIREMACAFSAFKTAVPARPSRAPAAKAKSLDPLFSAVAGILRKRSAHYDTIVDLGCGEGDGAGYLRDLYGRYLGGDFVEQERFPGSDSVGFRATDLNREPYPFDDASADAVVSIETIDRLENPYALVRQMSRILRPGGWLVVTTTNQLSAISKLHLVTNHQFAAFDDEFPEAARAHITPLVEADLRRIAGLCGLVDVDVRYGGTGRLPTVSRRWFSDHLFLAARRP
jgi:glycosyltransferase involved in cell wall biosynthesis